MPPAQSGRADPGTAQLFSGEVTGVIIQLPGWNYPTVIETTAGTVSYDNYGGHWGDQKELDRFLQIYAIEKATIEARKKGYSVTEQVLRDGAIKLQIIEV